MTTLIPRGYGGFPSYQFSPPNQINNQYYNGRYKGRGTSFAPHYPTQPLYQPPFIPREGYPSPGFNQVRQPGIGTQLVMFLNQLDEQYRYEQYLRKQEKLRNQYWKLQASAMPLPMYPAPPSLGFNYDPGTVYQYEKETKYIPYPVYINPGAGGYGYPPNIGYGAGRNVNYGTGGGMSLPPKVRVIFIPTGQSSLQQPYTGPLAMPPFLYNRMSQPLCSFPLPPPLPQLGSLPLTPAVQQMVMQRYSNPVAVLPFSSNCQMPQMMMPSYPQVPQQQQQPIVPISAFHTFPPAPQSYIPPSMPAFSSLPPAPQSYIPPPPPPSIVPANLSVPQPILSQPPFPDANAFSSLPQYTNSGYPSMCRACPPAPPPLNISVTGHCWIQHCAACHHVPTPDSNPNARPNGGRITPLLRHPTVPQYVPDQTTQQQYIHANAPVMMRPWLRKTPPLPPGAVVISDEYIDKYSSYSRSNYSQRQPREHQRSSRTKHRSTTVTSKPTSMTSATAMKNSRSTSPKRTNKNNNNPTEHQGPVKSKSTTSATSSSTTSTSGLSAEYHKVIIHSSKTQQNAIPQQLAGEARNINLQYTYQPQELPAVYLINRYLKSSSEASTLSSNHGTVSNCCPSSVKEHRQSSSSSSDLNSIKEEPNPEKEDEKSHRPPSQSTKPKEKLIIIREFTASSPSSVSTISSDMTFSIIDKDEDSLSATSTIKADELEEDGVLRREIF